MLWSQSTVNPKPFPWLVIDRFVTPQMLAQVNADWPADDWLGWVHYDARIEAKRASDRGTPLPAVCGEMLRRMASLEMVRVVGDYQTIPDLSLHGGGLHEMPPSGFLGLHLDSDRHPRLGLARTLSIVLYVHERWEPGWDGELELWDNPPASPVQRIQPLPGRLVAFATGDDSWHSVSPITGPLPRRSLALFGYGPSPGPGKRARALFVPRPGEIDQPGAEEARRKRAA